MTTNKILIVDDDLDYLFQLKLIVESFGFEVATAESQAEAEEFLDNEKPALAIYDLMMENEDSGFILSYKTKKLHPGVPVIIATSVTADTGVSFSLETEAEREWIRADLYLEKGIRPDQLHKEINRLLGIEETHH